MITRQPRTMTYIPASLQVRTFVSADEGQRQALPVEDHVVTLVTELDMTSHTLTAE